MSITRTTATVNLGLDAQYDRGTGMKFKIYSGAAPANASAALSGNTLLATMLFASTPFTAAANRVKTANAVTSDTDANATGDATFGRITKSDDTVVDQCSVSAAGGGGDAIISAVHIVQHTTVSCSLLTRTAGA